MLVVLLDLYQNAFRTVMLVVLLDLYQNAFRTVMLVVLLDLSRAGALPDCMALGMPVTK